MLTLQFRVKGATCAAIFCERTNSHGTRDFMGDMDV